MTDDDIQKQVSRESSSVTSATVGINADLSDIRGLRDGIKAIKSEAKDLANELTRARDMLKEMKESFGLTNVTREVNQAGAQGGRVQSGSSSGAVRGAAGTPIVGSTASSPTQIARPPMPASDASNNSSGGGGIGGFLGGLGKGGFAGGGSGSVGAAFGFGAGGGLTAGNIASMVTSIGSAITEAIDKRVEQGRAYSIAADRSTLQMQQLTGLSQRGVMGQLRTPLTNYKLGTNGINELLGLQAATGINAAQQASSVEFMRTLSGFGMSAGGAANVIENLAQADTVNRMFMMTGMSLVGPGGVQRDTKSIIQGLAQRAGLTDEKLAKSAIAPGSVTRATLTQMGVTGDLQEQVIQYAQANVQYRKKGGKGMYDPTRKADQKIMGIDNTFAMETEETERVRGARDEQFYQDQAGAYAKLERQTQTLTEAMTKLEHAVRGIISARTGNRVAMKLGAGVLGTIGAGFAGFGMGGPLGALAGIGLGAFNMFGDPPDDGTDYGTGVIQRIQVAPKKSIASSAPITSSTPSNNRPIAANPGLDQAFISGVLGTNDNLNPFVQGSAPTYYDSAVNPMYSKLDSNFKNQLNKLATLAARSGFNLTLVDGYRSREEQASEFLNRYQLAPDQGTTDPTRQLWNGKVYVKKPGNQDPPMKPPGQSWHELGQAVDISMSGTTSSGQPIEEWIKQYAPMVGIKSFADQGEPFHLQPAWTSGLSAAQVNNLQTGLATQASYGSTAATTNNSYSRDMVRLEGAMTNADVTLKEISKTTNTSSLLGLTTTGNDYGTYANQMFFRGLYEKLHPTRTAADVRKDKLAGIQVASNISRIVKRQSGSFDGGVYDSIRRGDPVSPLTLSAAAPMSNVGPGGATTINEGNTINIAPVIHMTSTGNNGTVSDFDLRAMAKRVARFIEQEANLSKMRGN